MPFETEVVKNHNEFRFSVFARGDSLQKPILSMNDGTISQVYLELRGAHGCRDTAAGIEGLYLEDPFMA